MTMGSPGQDGVAGIRVEQEVPDIRIYRVYRVKLNKATGDLDLIRAAGRWNPVNVGKASWLVAKDLREERRPETLGAGPAE